MKFVHEKTWSEGATFNQATLCGITLVHLSNFLTAPVHILDKPADPQPTTPGVKIHACMYVSQQQHALKV